MGMKRNELEEIISICSSCTFLVSGIGYYFAGLQVHKSATGTNVECKSHKDNLPTEFTVNGYGTKISEVGAENMSEFAQNLSQFYLTATKMLA